MNFDIIPFFGLCLCSAIIIVFIKQYRPEIAILISVVAGVLIILFCIRYLAPVFEFTNKIMGFTKLSNEYIVILIKVLGISYIVQFACDLCRDCGQQGLSNKLEIAGKVVIIALALPIFEKIISIVLATI